ncbi:uncharacterized protein LOC110827422 [Zootermopsis nevadensis]|uniref:uncharacterized protein LOC110827422 n=1 Tax=Zootermopsis nevadensis TaxID=136037 RepID=UPI000B8E3304|nr:uncharacterized protein LOC110827422 [Zootermopsis nevadensis]
MGTRTSRHVKSVARGIVMEVTFWLIFSAATTTCQPVQTLDEILQSVGREDSLLRADLGSIYAFTHKGWNPHIVENEVPAHLDTVNRNPRLYVVVDDREDAEQTNTTSVPGSENKREVDPRSLVWYMASFGGLVTFFLVVSCSECCCSKRTQRTPNSTSSARPAEPPAEVTQWLNETPPPPYHLFAPPSYETLFYESVGETKNKCEVYVVPIHSHVVTVHNTSSSIPAEPR